MKKLFKILLLVLIPLLIIGGFAVTRDKSYYDGSTPIPPAPEELAQGTIEGSLSYPSDFIPPLEICAENTKTKEEFCVYEMIKGDSYVHGFGYQIEVPNGNYHVYAKLSDQEKYDSEIDTAYRAYYSEFVTCGMDYECPSHQPVVVKVIEKETTSDVNPMDWYRNLEDKEKD